MLRRALTLAATAATLTACGIPTVTTAADKEAAISAPRGAATAGASTKSSTPKPAGIGDVITLKGSGDLKVAVKLNRVIQKGAPANELVKPEAGKRLFGVEIIMKNVGAETYDDSPSNGAKVVDSEGQEYDAALFGEIAGTHKLQATTMASDDTRKGVLAFEVPTAAKIVRFQLALNSGFADQKGSWKLK